MIRYTKRVLVLLPLLLMGSFAQSPQFAQAQVCSPRPRVAVSTVSNGPGGLHVTVTAGVGVISSIQFGAAANATVTIGGSPRTPPFTYTLATPTGQVAFDTARQGGAGTPVTVPFTVVDGCGPWSTFVGGGSQAWELPVSGQVLNAGDGQPIAGATVRVEGTSLTATTGGDGRFTIVNVPKGSQSLKTTASGFLADTRNVQIVAGAALIVGLHRPSTASLPTGTGTNVEVAPDASAGSGIARSSVTFTNVTAPGTTTIERVTTPVGVPPPTQGQVLNGAYFDVKSTAAFNGEIEVELPYDPLLTSPIDPAQIRLLHRDGDTWVDRTISVDPSRRVVKARVPHFSWFTVKWDSSLGIPPPSFPVQPKVQAGRKILFIPGIILACPYHFFGLYPLVTTFCDSARPYGAIAWGSSTFEAIRTHLRDTNALRPFTYGESDFRYFSYRPESDPTYRQWSAYEGQDVRNRTIEASARLLQAELAGLSVDGTMWDIVAHSLGGAIAAYWAFLENDPANRRMVRSVTTLDSPVNGLRNAVGFSAEIFNPSLGGEAARDLLRDPTISRMQSGALRPNFVTFATNEDRVVWKESAQISATCPKRLSAIVPECLYFFSGTFENHSIVLEHQLSLSQLDRILAGVTVTGTIVDSVTQQGLAGATVGLAHVAISTTTGPGGTFTLRSVPLSAQTQMLQVSMPGYQTRSDVQLADSPNAQVSLEPISLTSTMMPPTSWTQLAPSGVSPTGRVAHTSVWDSLNNQMLNFAGQGFVGTSFDYLNELWAFRPSSNQWSQLTPTGVMPPVRREHAAAWDSTNGRMLVFGGNNFTHLNDLWAYSPATNSWSQLNPSAPQPAPRAAHSALWDPTSQQFLVYGGHNGQYLGDLWAYSAATNSWTQRGLTGPSPGLRAFHTTIWDPAGNRLLLFAGQNDTGQLTDVWAYQPQTDTWNLLSPTNATPPIDGRAGHTAVWDDQNGQMVVFGGFTPAGYVNTVLIFRPAANAWSRPIASGSVPASRDNHAAVWDPVNRRMLVFSGFTGGAPPDLWSFTP